MTLPDSPNEAAALGRHQVGRRDVPRLLEIAGSEQERGELHAPLTIQARSVQAALKGGCFR